MNRPIPIQLSRKYFSSPMHISVPSFLRDFNFQVPSLPRVPNFDKPVASYVFTELYQALVISLVSDNVNSFLSTIVEFVESLAGVIERERFQVARDVGKSLSVLGSKYGALGYLPDSGAYQVEVQDLLLSELNKNSEIDRKFFELFFSYRGQFTSFAKGLVGYNGVLVDLYSKDLSFYEKFFKEFFSVVVDSYIFEILKFNFVIEFNSLVFDFYEKSLRLKEEYLNLVRKYQALNFENVELLSLINRYEQLYAVYRNKVNEFIQAGVVELEVLRSRKEAELKKFASDIRKAGLGVKYVNGLMDVYRRRLAISELRQEIEREKLAIFDAKIGLKRRELELNEKEVSVAFSEIVKTLAMYESDLRKLEVEMEKYLKQYDVELLEFRKRVMSTLDSFYSNYKVLVDWLRTESEAYLTNKEIADSYVLRLDYIAAEANYRLDGVLDRIRILSDAVVNVNRTIALSCANITSRVIRSMS
ncbi:MAG: hypothetical protein QXT86_08925 [Archaeoglobaceae archaeon]